MQIYGMNISIFKLKLSILQIYWMNFSIFTEISKPISHLLNECLIFTPISKLNKSIVQMLQLNSPLSDGLLDGNGWIITFLECPRSWARWRGRCTCAWRGSPPNNRRIWQCWDSAGPWAFPLPPGTAAAHSCSTSSPAWKENNNSIINMQICSEIARKLLGKCSEIALESLWNSSEDALKLLFKLLQYHWEIALKML